MLDDRALRSGLVASGCHSRRAVVMITAHNGLDGVQPVLSEASPVGGSAHPGYLKVSGTPIASVVYPWFLDRSDGARLRDRFILCGPGLPVPRSPADRRLLTLSFLLLRLAHLYGDRRGGTRI